MRSGGTGIHALTRCLITGLQVRTLSSQHEPAERQIRRVRIGIVQPDNFKDYKPPIIYLVGGFVFYTYICFIPPTNYTEKSISFIRAQSDLGFFYSKSFRIIALSQYLNLSDKRN